MNTQHQLHLKHFFRKGIFSLAKIGLFAKNKILKRRWCRFEAGKYLRSPACSSVGFYRQTLKRVFSCFDGSEVQMTQAIVAFEVIGTTRYRF
jgi:hypothetical protein